MGVDYGAHLPARIFEKPPISYLEINQTIVIPATKIAHVVVFAVTVIMGLSGCSRTEHLSVNDHRDTTVRVYGPYAAIKLPIT